MPLEYRLKCRKNTVKMPSAQESLCPVHHLHRVDLAFVQASQRAALVGNEKPPRCRRMQRRKADQTWAVNALQVDTVCRRKHHEPALPWTPPRLTAFPGNSDNQSPEGDFPNAVAVIALALACNEELAVAVEGRSARARELSSQGWTVAMALCASSRNRRDLGGVGVNSAITVVGWG